MATSITTHRPLTAIEQRFYHAWCLSPDDSKHNLSVTYRIRGPLDIHRLYNAMQQYSEHLHPETQCTIQESKDGPCLVPLKNPILDWALHTEHPDINAWINEQHHQAFNLNQDPSIRIRLLQQNPHDHILIISQPHVVCDLTTAECMVAFVSQAYVDAAEVKEIPRHTMTQPSQAQGHHDTWHYHHFSSDERQSIIRCAKALGTTPFLLLTGLWTWLLAQHQDTATVTYPVDTRPKGTKSTGCVVAHRHLTIPSNATTLRDITNLANQSYRTPIDHTMGQHLVSQSLIHQTVPTIPGLQIDGIPLPTAVSLADTWLALELRDTFTIGLMVNESKHTSEQAKAWLQSFIQLVRRSSPQPSQTLPRPQVVRFQTNTNSASQEPRDAMEFQIHTIWQRALGHQQFGIHSHWHDAGGSSSEAIAAMLAMNQHFQSDLAISWFLQYPTIAAQAKALQHNNRQNMSSIYQVYQRGDHATLILVHPGAGGMECYSALLPLLPKDITIIGIDNPHLHPSHPRFDSIEAMASCHIRHIRAWTIGPIILAGWSMGGIIAHEMACQWPEVSEVFLWDSQLLNERQLRRTMRVLGAHRMHQWIPGERGQHINEQDLTYRQQLTACAQHECQLLIKHRPSHCQVPLTLYRAEQIPYRQFAHLNTRYDHGWFPYTKHLHIIPMPCDHFSMMEAPHINAIGKHIMSKRSTELA